MSESSSNDQDIVHAPPLKTPPLPQDNRGLFRNTPGIYAALALALLTIVFWNILGQLQWLLIILYLAVLLAAGISEPVRWLERRGLNRALAILIIFAFIAGIILAMLWYTVPPLVGQVVAFLENIPHYISQFQHLQERLDEWEQTYPAIAEIEQRVYAFSGQLGGVITNMLLNLPGTIAKATFSVVSIVTFSFLFLMSWERLKTTFLLLIHPRHREITEEVLGEIGLRLGAYLRAKVIVMTIIGIWIYITLKLLDSPYALLAAILVAFMEVIPRIGPWIGRVGILLAVLPLGWEAAVIAMISSVIIENIKGYGLSPLIEGHQVDIQPLTAFVAVIAGGLLLGWIGALVAVPTAAAIQVIFVFVLIPWRRRQLEPAEREMTATVKLQDSPTTGPAGRGDV